MIPAVTALYGSLNAILNVALAANVSRARGKYGVSIGPGKAKEIETAVRVHANNSEFVPLALVMLLIAELCGGSNMVLHIAGGALLLFRIFHAIGLPRPAPNFFRFAGAGGTSLVIAGLAIWTILLRR